MPIRHWLAGWRQLLCNPFLFFRLDPFWQCYNRLLFCRVITLISSRLFLLVGLRVNIVYHSWLTNSRSDLLQTWIKHYIKIMSCSVVATDLGDFSTSSLLQGSSIYLTHSVRLSDITRCPNRVTLSWQLFVFHCAHISIRCHIQISMALLGDWSFP